MNCEMCKYNEKLNHKDLMAWQAAIKYKKDGYWYDLISQG